MADTDFTDTTTTTPGTTIVAAWLDDVNKHVYWGRNVIFATTAGTANAQTLTLPATSLYSAYSGGDRFMFKAGAGLTNTTTCTLQVIGASTLAAKTIKNLDGSNLVAGQITAARVYEVIYEATADCFYLLGGIAILNDLAVDTLSATGVITSTLATGTAPFTVTSTTMVSNLNADQLDGADWAAPAAIGTGTPAAGTFTTGTFSGTLTPQALVDISGASAGQVKFPATQNPSADENTLDDYDESTFTATLTGCTTAPTGTVYVATMGKVIQIDVPAFTATSNATTKTLTGMPAGLRPATDKRGVYTAQDNSGAAAAALFNIGTDGVITLYPNANGDAWTASGTFVSRTFCISYTLN